MSRMSKLVETSGFRPLNVNPRNRIAADCTVRAISAAMGKSWMEVYDSLCSVGRSLARMPNENKTEEEFLEKTGWMKHPQPRWPDGSKYTARKFLELFRREYPGQNCIARVGGHHVSAIVDGKWQDIWDVEASGKCVGNWWTVI